MQEGWLKEGNQTHASFSFFNFPASTTQAIASHCPTFNYSVEFKVLMSVDFFTYMDSQTMAVDFFHMPQSGWVASQFGSATICLKDVMNALADGHGAYIALL